MIITTIEPAPEPGQAGRVLDCFRLPFDDVTEVVLCDDEISFVRADGTIVNAIDLDTAEVCPRCGAGPDAQFINGHTCTNPLFTAAS